MKTLFLVSNSPGEVSTFVRPVVSQMSRTHPDWRLRVCLVPCPYATGAEADVIASWPEAPEVWTPWQTTKAWLTGSGKGLSGAVVFLGGDPWHALLLKRRFQLPCMAYFWEPNRWEQSRWLGGFDRVARGYRGGGETDCGRIVSVSDLRVDAVQAKLASLEVADGRPLTLALFPGSRWFHLKCVLGPFLKVVDDLMERLPNLKVLLAASPFVSRERLSLAASSPLDLGISYTTAGLQGDHLVTSRGSTVEVVWADPYRVMAECHCALSLPGSNTAELAIAGKPTVVPLTSRVPVGGSGLLGLLDRLPGPEPFKRYLRERKRKRLSLVALPNQLANRVIMPEFLVRDDLQDLSDFLFDLLMDGRRQKAIGQEARDVMGPSGGALELVSRLMEIVPS